MTHYARRVDIRKAILIESLTNQLHQLAKTLPSHLILIVSNAGVVLATNTNIDHYTDMDIPQNATLLDDGTILLSNKSEYAEVEVDPHCRAGLVVQQCATT